MGDGGSGRFDAVILAGGRARRLGGIDKPALRVGGTSLLGRAVDAAASAGRVIVVGPPRDLGEVHGHVVRVQEEPAGGGPVAALAAGLGATSAPIILVLGADLPFIDRDAVDSLAERLAEGDADGVVATDGARRDQYLCAAYRRSNLASGIEDLDEVAGASMHELVAGLNLIRLDLGARSTDLDTPEDLTRFS
jgi:molybdopterin-guanine dinucleotide biosynthesis protein A